MQNEWINAPDIRPSGSDVRNMTPELFEELFGDMDLSRAFAANRRALKRARVLRDSEKVATLRQRQFSYRL